MILKVRNLDNDAWNYFDNVRQVSVERGKWCFVKDKGVSWLYAVMVKPIPVDVGALMPTEFKKQYYINTGVVTHCSQIFISYADIRYNDSEKGDADVIQTVDLIRFSMFGSDVETTIAVHASTNAFLLNSEGKTIERII